MRSRKRAMGFFKFSLIFMVLYMIGVFLLWGYPAYKQALYYQIVLNVALFAGIVSALAGLYNYLKKPGKSADVHGDRKIMQDFKDKGLLDK